MTINERLQYIEARMKQLYSSYATDIGRIRGIEHEEAPMVVVSISSLKEDANGREKQTYDVEVMLKKAPSATNPFVADRELLADQITHLNTVRTMLRSSSFREGQGVADFDKGAFGAVQEIEAEFIPVSEGAVLISSLMLSFSVLVDNRYADPDADLLDLEHMDAHVSFDGGDPIDAEVF